MPYLKIFQNCRRAYCLTYKKGEIKTFAYWQLEAKDFSETQDEAVEHTYYLVKDSIERQLVSDVPLAHFYRRA